jgi:hypothetical protein
MCCDHYFDQFAKKEEIYVSSMCVAEMLLATDHMWNASRLVSAVELLCLMGAYYTGQEDGSLGDRFVDAFITAVDNVAGDGLSGHGGKVVYPRMLRAKSYLFYQ